MLAFIFFARSARNWDSKNSLNFRRLPARIVTCQFDSLVHALVASVPEGRMLLTMQQRASNVDVAQLGCPAHHRMHQALLRVHTNVRLRAKVPLDPFLGLVHFWVARVASVFGRTGCCNDDRVHDGAGMHRKYA